MFISIITIAFAFILGACLGSFANVLAIRWHEMGTLGGRSRCPKCKTTIRAKHLVPIFSWFFLRGKCSYCGVKIHIQYPLVEFVAGSLAVIAAIRHNPFSEEFPLFAVELGLGILLLAIAVMDWRWKELPVEILTIIGVSAAVIHLFALRPWPFVLSDLGFGIWNLILAAGLGVLFFGAQWLLSRGKWLGSGDVWFGAMMGLVLGSWQLTGVAIYLSYLVGGLAAAILLLTKIIKRGGNIPFAPFLTLGLMLTFWFGPAIQAWLTKMFFLG
ncbi:MAG: prepilin peptidase [Patescibacteria group bacterium]|nr:prepilin peptidase [Patescibacteria group bacterium]MBU2509420.1 prepilin peptidase [Patescibacteria group bacterium]